MKKYKFTIRGHEYNVHIQEVEGDQAKIEVNGTCYEVQLHQEVKKTKTPTLVRQRVQYKPEVLEGRALSKMEDPEEQTKYAAEKEQEYKDKFANPYEAARYGYIDDVIEPRNTRFRIIRALQALATKKDSNPPKKHSNLPL